MMVNSNKFLQKILKYKQSNFTIIKSKKINILKKYFNFNEIELAHYLLNNAKFIAKPAISNYKVGAISIGKSGNFYFGGNIEFKDTPLFNTIHAEQSSICNAWINHEKKIISLVVSSTPCGHCRQFLLEVNKKNNLQICLPNNKHFNLTYLLRHSFKPNVLVNNEYLLKKRNNNLILNTEDQYIKNLLIHANKSYAPYTNSPAAVALITKNNYISYGRIIESIAHNPTIYPTNMALYELTNNNIDYSNITKAILIQKCNSKINYEKHMKYLLSQFCKPKYETYLAKKKYE